MQYTASADQVKLANCIIYLNFLEASCLPWSNAPAGNETHKRNKIISWDMINIKMV